MRRLVLFVALWALLLLPKDYAVDTTPVVFMGDSVAWGAWASSWDHAFVSLVRDDLKSRGIDDPFELLITMTAYNDLASSQKAANRYRSLIIVEVGVHWADVYESGQFRQLYGMMLDCLQGSGATVVVGTIPWLGWEPVTAQYAKMRLFSQIIREEASKRGIAVADLWAATDKREEALSQPGQPCLMGGVMGRGCDGDGYHPGDIGHALIAKAYAKALDVALANPPTYQYANRCNYNEYFHNELSEHK